MNRTSRIVAGAATAASTLYLLACGVLGYNARSLLYHPTPRSGDVANWRFARSSADIVVSGTQRESDHLVLYFGGNAEDVSLTLPMLEQVYPQAAIHAMHYRGYGGSTGVPTERDLVADALALHDALAAPGTRVTIVGRSLGTGIAIQLAAARPSERLVLITPYNSIAELGQQRFPIFPVRLLLRDRYESWRYAPGIHTPTTIVVAGKDEVICNESSWRLADCFPPGVARVLDFPEADHTTALGLLGEAVKENGMPSGVRTFEMPLPPALALPARAVATVSVA